MVEEDGSQRGVGGEDGERVGGEDVVWGREEGEEVVCGMEQEDGSGWDRKRGPG